MTGPAGNRNCLHLVVRFSTGAMERCLSQLTKGDLILFLNDGVMHLPGWFSDPGAARQADCCFAAEDLEARGLLQLARQAGANIICDSEFAELLGKYGFCLTWK